MAQTWDGGRGAASYESRATTGVRSSQEADDESDTSFLDAGAVSAKAGQIMRTEESSVKYRERRIRDAGTLRTQE